MASGVSRGVCEWLRSDEPLPEALQYLIVIPPGHTVANVVEAWLVEHPDGLVLVDTLGRARPPQQPGESVYQYDYRTGVELKSLTDTHPGSALVVVHHDRKADAVDFVETVSGSNGLAGSADTLLIVRRERAKPEGLLQVTGRDVIECVYAVSFVSGVWSLQGESLDEAAANAAAVAAGLGRGHLAQQIVEYITEHGSATLAQLKEAEAIEASYEAIKQAVYRMHDAWKLDRIERGVYVLAPKPPRPTRSFVTFTGPQSNKGRDGTGV
jgi:hypothetical protein